jgi:Protein of unknown function (DUF3128)
MSKKLDDTTELFDADISSSKKSISDVTCIDIFDRLWYCGTPVNQLNRFYRTGDIEYCHTYAFDWTACMKARFIKDNSLREVSICLYIYLSCSSYI